MRRGPAIVASLGLMVVVVLGPLAALASPGRGGPRNGPGMSVGGRPSGAPRGNWTGFHGGVSHRTFPKHGHPATPHRVPPPHTIFPKHSPHGFRHGHGFKHFPCCGVITWGAPLYYGGYAYNGGPAYYYPPPTYYVYAPQWYTYAPAYTPPTPSSPPPPPADTDTTTPAPEATSQVIQYPNGRYELRGDGSSVPYTWVWIPKPPPPPPDPPAGTPTSGDPAPSRHGPVYRWTDEDGVVHWTDRLDSVPPRYRTEATHTGSSAR